MKAAEFCYWLRGYFEIRKAKCTRAIDLSISAEQADTIENHLAMVFAHELDATHGPQSHQDELQAIHDGKLPGDVKMRC